VRVKPCDRRKNGQVVVEMLLILPVFLTIVFSIMEMGHLAFWTIVINHATYESARIGSLLATGLDGGEPRDMKGTMNNKFVTMFPTGAEGVAVIRSPRIVQSFAQNTLFDDQAKVMNNDLVVTGACDVRLIFPISSVILANPRGSGWRRIDATVRMPIERPLQK
jgi:hypothetical protein